MYLELLEDGDYYSAIGSAWEEPAMNELEPDLMAELRALDSEVRDALQVRNRSLRGGYACPSCGRVCRLAPSGAADLTFVRCPSCGTGFPTSAPGRRRPRFWKRRRRRCAGTSRESVSTVDAQIDRENALERRMEK